MRVYLDDWREPSEGFTVVRTFEEFKEIIKNHREEITEISLDYDLDSYKYNGLDACMLLHSFDFYPTKINIHSTHSRKVEMYKFLKDNAPEECEITINPYP
jgi:hypothetical protein